MKKRMIMATVVGLILGAGLLIAAEVSENMNYKGDVNFDAGCNWKIKGTKVTATAAQINQLSSDGVVATGNILLEDATSKITSGESSGGTSTSIELVPKATVSTNNVTRLVRVGDVTVGDYFGFNASTNKRTVLLSVMGGRKSPAGPLFDTTGDMGLHVGLNNNATNDAAYVAKAAYIKAKNSTAGTVGTLYGLEVENQQDGTATTTAIVHLKDTGSSASTYKVDMYDSKTPTADIRFSNGALVKNADANTLQITEATVGITGNANISGTIVGSNTVTITGTATLAAFKFSGCTNVADFAATFQTANPRTTNDVLVTGFTGGATNRMIFGAYGMLISSTQL
jgi:hypothetical protein